MTVGDLIKKLQKVDQKKKVQIVGQLDGNRAGHKRLGRVLVATNKEAAKVG